MFNFLDLLPRLRRSPPPPDTSATPTVVADATPRPLSPQMSAPLDGMSISSLQRAPEPATGPSISSPPPAPSPINAASDRFDAATPAAPATPRSPSQQFAELFNSLNLSSSNPPPQSPEPVPGSSVLSSSHQDDAVTDRDASEHVGSTSRATVIRRRGGLVAFKFGPARARKEKKKKKQQKKKKLEKEPSRSIADLQHRLGELERARDALLEVSASQGIMPMPPPHEIGAPNTPQHAFPGAARSKRTEYKSAPYGGGRKPKVKAHVKLPDPPFEDESQPDSPTRLPALPTIRPRYRAPTPYRRPIELPSDDVDEENSAPTRTNTPPPTETTVLGLFDLGSRTPVRRPTLEKIDIPANATPVSVTAQEAQALPTANPESTSPTYLTPASSTPGLYADSRRATSPAESPLPKTPINASNGFDGQVADSSPKPPGYYDVFGRPDEDRDDFGPSLRRKSGKAATAESATAPPCQQPLPPLPALALPLAETVVVSDVPAQLFSDPSLTIAAPAPQREMSWMTLPVSSLPAVPQPFQLQPQSALAQPSVVWGQAPLPSSWQQSPFSVPASTSTWMVPPPPVPSSFLTQSVSAFSQPIAIPQLLSFVQNVAPPQAPQPEADVSMDVDPFVDIAASHLRPQRHRAGRDYRRVARQLLRVAAIQPGLDLRKRVARRMFHHLFAIRQRPIAVNAFQGDRAARKNLAIQRRNRKALRSARRSVRQMLRRSGRAARSRRPSPQSAPRLIQRTMSIEMAIEDSSQTSVECTDLDVDMDVGDLPAIPAIPTVPTVEVADETMTAEDVFQSLVSRIPADEPAQMPIEPPTPIPTIVVTPETPLPEPELQKDLRASPEPSDSAPSLLSASFIPRPVMSSDSAETKKTASPLRQESSLAECEVPLTKAATPTDVHDPAPAPVVVAVLTPAAVYEAVVEAQSESSVTETEPPVTETEQQSVESDAGEETDDEAEWEPVPVPTFTVIAPATPTAEAAPVEESASPAETAAETETAPVEHTAGDTPVDIPLPNIAGEGPEIVFSSNERDSEDDDDDDDDDDVVSLDASEDERERRLLYGQEYADEGEDDEDYEDDGAEDDEEAEEGTEEEETEEEDDDDDDESNEYDESAPINGPVKRPSAPASAAPDPSPVPTPASAPAATVKGPESLSMPVYAPSTLPPSSVPTGGLTGGPYIGSVAERFNESAGYGYSNNLLSNAANVSSGNTLNGEAGLQAREAARRRNYENQVRQRHLEQDMIRSIKAKLALPAEPPSPVLPETTTPGISEGASTIVVDQDVSESHRPSQDLGMTEQVSKDFPMPADEDAETTAPRNSKGKGKATNGDVVLADRAPDLDPSSKAIADGMGLSPAEVQYNMNAFPKADSKGKAPLSFECGCSRLLNGPSSGHTLACQRARGVFTTPLVVPKSSSHSGFGHSVSPSPTAAFVAPATHQDSKPSVIEASPQSERPPSVLKAEVNTIPVVPGELESTQPFIGLHTTSIPTTYDQSPPVTELVTVDMDQQFTGPAKAWADLFANAAQAATAEPSRLEADTQEPSVSVSDFTFQFFPNPTLLPSTIDPSALDFSVEVQKMSDADTTLTHDDAAMDEEIHFSPAETAPPTSTESSAPPFGLGAEIVLDGPPSDWLFSILDQENMFDIDSVSQNAALALPVSGGVDGCVADTIPQICEGNSAVLKEADHEEMGEFEVSSYPSGTSSNEEQQDHSLEASALGFAPFDKQPQLESDISDIAAAEPRAGARTGVQEEAFFQTQPFEQSLPAGWAPQPLVELAAPLPPTTIPTPPPYVTQEEVVHRAAEERTEELAHIESAPSLVGEQEAEHESPAADVSVPPSTPLVRRRSGGARDRIACPHEKRTYYGPRPSSAQWQAYLHAGSPRVERPPSCTTNKSSSPLPPPALRLPAHRCGPNPLRSTSTSPDATAIAEPAHPHIPSRGRPRQRPTIPAAVDRSKSKPGVTPEAIEMDVSTAMTKHRRSKGNVTSKEVAHVPTSSTSSASHHPCLPPSDCPSPPQQLSLPSWAKPPCCPDFSRTGQKPCIHALRANGQLAGTQWESESSDSELEEEKDASSSAEQGWSAGYLAKLSLAAGAFYFLESVVF
ncbi:hypothetical protein V8D89_002122 [Ganoderma adspersum]